VFLIFSREEIYLPVPTDLTLLLCKGKTLIGAGPNVGEQIDLQGFRDRNGLILTNVVGELLLIVLVDPQCGACVASRNEMRNVRDRVTSLGVRYYPVSLTSSVPAADFFSYTDSLALGARGYLWVSNDRSPSQSLYSMVLPSHILINRNGTIIRKWPGTSTNESIRQRMANQIVSDTRQELFSRSYGSEKIEVGKSFLLSCQQRIE
jgi:hypothetical protein